MFQRIIIDIFIAFDIFDDAIDIKRASFSINNVIFVSQREGCMATTAGAVDGDGASLFPLGLPPPLLLAIMVVAVGVLCMNHVGEI